MIFSVQSRPECLGIETVLDPVPDLVLYLDMVPDPVADMVPGPVPDIVPDPDLFLSDRTLPSDLVHNTD
jgi:hypothetical protein